MSHITINRFHVVKDHPYLRALADIAVSGFVLRGIKLEERRDGTLALAFPGRKIQGSWQIVCETEDQKVQKSLLQTMTERFQAALTA